MKRNRSSKPVSSRLILIGSFMTFVLITGGLISMIVFSNWWASTDVIITNMEVDVTKDAIAQVDSFLDKPLSNNAANRILVEKGLVDMTDATERERFFVGVLQAQNIDVYGFGFGGEDGAYYGARRNQNHAIEIIKNDTETNGSSWHYSVTEALTAGEKILDAGKFDPRTSAWYLAAKIERKSVFSPAYKYSTADDLSVSAAYPIFNQSGALQGVLETQVNLSRINDYLHAIVKEESAMAFIVEVNTGALVASSSGILSYKKTGDNAVERQTIDAIDNPAIIQAFDNYKENGVSHVTIKMSGDTLHINMTAYKKNELDWLLITAIPAKNLTAGIVTHMQLAGLLTILALLAFAAAFMKFTHTLLKPIDTLAEAAGDFAAGKLSARVALTRNNEVGRLSQAFNKMADTSEHLITHLDEEVKERTAELQAANQELKENKDELQLILDSTAEAIYGMDTHGTCTFCNASSLRILGYERVEDLLGQNMHAQIHHSYRDSKPMLLADCKIMAGIISGTGTHVADEVFWKADGSSFDVEYNSYPQFLDGKVIGAVTTFTDITEHKRAQDEIQYLSFHDSLTGLYNRAYFEAEFKRLDTPRNLPFSILVGDVNNLKLTNDVFGHSAGDDLLRKVAEVFRRICRADDIIARTGGDEFVILLPQTQTEAARGVLSRINQEFKNEQVAAINVSISMGCDTKTEQEQNLTDIMGKAEAMMYQGKTLNRKTSHVEVISTIMATLQAKHPREVEHAHRVSGLCQDIGKAMNLSEEAVRKVTKTGYLHDIGKITQDDDVLENDDFGELDKGAVKQHSVVGYRILNAFEETMDLAEVVLAHHECWDGSGYPKGIQGNEIPDLARVITVADAFDIMTKRRHPINMTPDEAMREIEKQSGTQFDPVVVRALAKTLTSPSSESRT